MAIKIKRQNILGIFLVLCILMLIFILSIRKGNLLPSDGSKPTPMYAVPSATGGPTDLPYPTFSDRGANPLPVESAAKTKRICQYAGGTWKEFPNSCVDSCGEDLWCQQVLTEGCECGASQCWDGANCVNN